jgi:hypothetical protein
LWDEVHGGYQIHDYGQWQRTKAEILEDRAKKVAAGQAGGQASARARAKAGDQAKSNPQPQPQPNVVISKEITPASPQPPKQEAPNGAPESGYRQLLCDDYWSALTAFKQVDPHLSNGWLDKALKRAPAGLSTDQVFEVLTNALNRIADDFQRNEAESFIKSKYGWANTIIDEEFTDMKAIRT